MNREAIDAPIVWFAAVVIGWQVWGIFGELIVAIAGVYDDTSRASVRRERGA